jgi:predicted permease
MNATLGAVVPVFLVILLGLALRQRSVLPDAFWAPAEKLTYFITFPALLAANLAKADMGALDWESLMGVQVVVTLVVSAGLVLAMAPPRRRVLSGPAFGSAFQGAIRPNTYVGLAVAAALQGQMGVTLTAICIAAIVPLVNVLSVICLATLGKDQSISPLGLARSIASNPLILGCLVGIALNASGVGLPPIIGPFLEILGRAALPVGLLAVGAGLTLDGGRGGTLAIAWSSIAKLAVTPTLVWIGGWALGWDGPTLVMAVLYGALPCSASSYILARRMGGDAPLMATIITVQTLLSAVTIPVFALLLQA